LLSLLVNNIEQKQEKLLVSTSTEGYRVFIKQRAMFFTSQTTENDFSFNATKGMGECSSMGITLKS